MVYGLHSPLMGKREVHGVAKHGVMRSVLHNFLGTYTSRHSDYRGYWVLGHLPLDLREWTLDLVGPAPDWDAPADAARRLAILRFAQQVSKSGLATGRIREATLHVATSSEVVEGWHGNHMTEGRLVRFCARAVVDNGCVYEDEQSVFVAPHDPGKECRRAEANWGHLTSV